LRFARDEHELLLRHLFQIWQTGPVNEYIDQFVALVDDLKAYAKHPDPLYYTQRFIVGLKDEIKVVILVHRPTTLDIACVLAQLQEEALAASKKPFRHYDHSPHKSAWSSALPLSAPPVQQGADDVKRPPDTTHSTVEARFQALHALRRAKGLCICYGAKWSCDQKCSEVVQLHLVQELLGMFSDDSDDAEAVSPDSLDSQVMMHVSVAAMVGAQAPKTLSLRHNSRHSIVYFGQLW
jgi:hypothetical protein